MSVEAATIQTWLDSLCCPPPRGPDTTTPVPTAQQPVARYRCTYQGLIFACAVTEASRRAAQAEGFCRGGRHCKRLGRVDDNAVAAVSGRSPDKGVRGMWWEEAACGLRGEG